jgi:hypothetical protein
VAANYGLTHPKQSRPAANKSAALPDLFFDHSGITAIAGNTISVPIKLGTTATPVTNIAGIAATIMIDGVFVSDTPALSYAGSWLGNSANTLHFTKAISQSRLDWAYARTDHRNNSGSGTLAWLNIHLPAGSGGQQMQLYFDKVMLVDSNGDQITQFNILDDTLTIMEATGIAPNARQLPGIYVLPNPSSGACRAMLSLPAAGSYSLEISDMSGRLIWRATGKGSAGQHSIELPAEAISAGIYLINLSSNGQAARPVLWVKE